MGANNFLFVCSFNVLGAIAAINQSNIKDLLKIKEDCLKENNCIDDTSSSEQSTSIESSILKKIK